MTKQYFKTILSPVALKDLGRGWGDLPSYLKAWHCPNPVHKKNSESSVEDWTVEYVQLGADKVEGRKCPKCDWVASQTGQSFEMIPADVREKIKKREAEDEAVRVKSKTS